MENRVLSSPPSAEYQFALPGLSGLANAVSTLANSSVEERGAIFTKREVVEFILDLTGYTPNAALHQQKLLEPSFGNGDFLLPAIDRLIASFTAHCSNANPLVMLKDAIRGVELHIPTFNQTFSRVTRRLVGYGLSKSESATLAECWLRCCDFLLSDFKSGFTHIVGNPPYVRQELIPDALMAEYRRRYATIFDRADLYIPFIEHSLSLLANGGQLGIICADRWMKNRYGRPLRQLVSSKYRLRTYVDMVNTPAFHSAVVAYPAIFVIANEPKGSTRIAHRPNIDKQTLARLSQGLIGGTQDQYITEVPNVAPGGEPWVFDSLDRLAVVRRLEANFPLLEETGCKVSIGVATGADKIFIAPFESLDVEDERKLPLVMARDVVSGIVQWQGKGVLNPFMPDGRLAPLQEYPRFASYLKRHAAQIKKRHVAQKNPETWYRTIDRIDLKVTSQQKLLVPDIKGNANIVFEDGKLYPHHNLYYITSNSWDLRALQTVLLSGIAKLFVATYSTKMRGEYMRFQAQYIRRIRLPRWESVPNDMRRFLADPANHADEKKCNEAVAALYGLSVDEQQSIFE